MSEIAFQKVSQIMKTSPLVFSSTDTVSSFIGSLYRLNSYEAVVVFKHKVGLVTARDVLDAINPECTLLGNVARSVSSLSREATVLDAVNFMVSNGIRAIPIMEDGEVIGMVSCTEVLNAMMKSSSLMNVMCKEVMKSLVASVNVNEKISTARSIMYEYDISNLPVVDEVGRLIGIITARDIVFTYVQPEESVTQGEITGESVRIWDTPVKNLMDVELLTARGEDPLISLIKSFRRLNKEICIIEKCTENFNVITPMEIIALLLNFKIEETVYVRILGLPDYGDFLSIATAQDKIIRVLSRGVTFRKDIREVVIDIKRRKRSGKRTLYQVGARVHSSARSLVVTAQGWYLGEALDKLCEKLDKVLRKSKKRKPRIRIREV